MMFTMIFARDLNGAIGKDGDLPWRQSSDLQHFKRITMSKTIVMGRKTWDSLPGKLPGRRNIVLSRTPREDVEVLSFEEVLKKGLKIMDTTAFTLSQENKLPIIVFDMNTKGNLVRVVRGENIGTKVDL